MADYLAGRELAVCGDRPRRSRGERLGGVGGALSGGVVGVGGRVDSAFVSPVGGIGGGSGAAGREGGGAGLVGGASAPRSPHRGRRMTDDSRSSDPQAPGDREVARSAAMD